MAEKGIGKGATKGGAKDAGRGDAKGKVDLGTLSLPELRQLARDVEEHIKWRKEEDRKRVRQQMRELAASIGMTVEEVLGYGVERKSKGRVLLPPKYRNPENPEETWSGKGHRPQWVKEALESGRKLEEMEIR
jgi:DNA-binding protein H-NS